ncbi:ABC transporter permease [Ruania rhizosphaerae]|uniref:ABC transporter permease n=1 Tax=Ruania rhizosphaerae TaxID=1840413 RepID=UPI00135A6921|nr:ABC transporter permease [Ruania rhizosphaerae]
MSIQTQLPALRATGRRRGTAQRGEARWTFLLIAVVLAILAVWEAVVRAGLVPEAFLPPPSKVLTAFLALLVEGEFWQAFAFSMGNVVVGLALAIVVGVVVGLAVGWSPVLRFTVAPFLWLLYSTPKVALAPVIILALGLGSESKIALTFLLAVFPILLNTMEGAVTVSPSLVRAARVFGVRGPALGWKVIFPATLPFSLAGIRRGAALGFTGEVLGEFLGGTGGLGHMLEQAAYQFEMDEALAMVVVMVIIANLTLSLIGLLQRKLAPWHDERTAAAS